ncbi:exopolysaccharide biosynthesis polyprenyl glycosylphosphotransferase [Streptomyces qinzhouensis]|uniref:Exopolysaccharide biosynthesis polyprenyl glycosylphosphotransferase n=1 Tax=Streptomyces qinzhouensis TaxID=2599401 RepID=A0A5B8JMG8_9ACTN|nr:exopolysaccharide biosynthesis polyprenyl glycosylphosphotransferase [Streptomyces qinzhouensis]QDY78743.1 exopolysaccharide biosynthesis polyprenyl glycosylphosphotransferase [Streptomyces qinzhouensis]
MTTESAPAPHHHRAVTVPSAVTALHPPRRTARHRHRAARAVRRGTAAARYEPAAGLLATDTVALGLTAALLLPLLPWPAAVLAGALLVQPAAHACRGLYRPRLSPSALTEIPALAGLGLLQWLVLTEAAAAYDPSLAVDKAVLALAVVLQTGLCAGARALLYAARKPAAARRPRSALVIGSGPLASQITAALADHPGYGMRPVGLVGTAPAGSLPQLTTAEEVGRAVVQNAVRHAVFTEQPGTDHESGALVALFAQHGVRQWLVDGGATTGNRWYRAAGPDHLWGFAVQPLHGGLHRPVARAVKRIIDTVLAGLALLAAAPVLAVCALAVRLSDGPGVIFRQERVGLDGRPFTLLKFRTLAPADDHESATRWNIAYDHRMSATGSVLRRTSLDELPQLWNVVRGDMSLVGPRPERPYYVGRFSHTYPGYAARHRMPVGITGLAQVNGLRGDTSIEERARFDNHYIETWSPWQDLCIMARTAVSLFRLGGS